MMNRRHFLTAAGVLPFASALPQMAQAQPRTFAPASGAWRTFEVVTKVELIGSGRETRAWIPVPNVSSEWQQSQDSRWSGNAQSVVAYTDPASDARMVYAQWAPDEGAPRLEVVSRVRTRDRVTDWKSASTPQGFDLGRSLRPTALIPTDGIVKATAQSATRGKTSDVDKVRAIYDWVVENTYREPTVRGCGVGDIKAMLETRNMGGKCADLNALFVGLCRSVGVPARDLYGVRVAKSKFPYKELGAGTADITKAQHCRSDVWLQAYGWVAVDPADVAKVMRQETPEWIRTTKNDVVAPVYEGLFGNWEGNWMAYNTAHDVALTGSKAAVLPFLMYPQAEVRGERVDSYDPETFKYSITANEIVS
jgi:transglutaminase-like putative cysteine protease